MLPPLLVSGSFAGGRARRRPSSGRFRWSEVVMDASYGGTRRHPAKRSFAIGRAGNQTTGSRAGSRTRTYP
jgi:hypothetical protein